MRKPLQRRSAKRGKSKRTVNNVSAESIIQSNFAQLRRMSYNAPPKRCKRKNGEPRNYGNDAELIQSVFGGGSFPTVNAKIQGVNSAFTVCEKEDKQIRCATVPRTENSQSHENAGSQQPVQRKAKKNVKLEFPKIKDNEDLAEYNRRVDEVAKYVFN